MRTILVAIFLFFFLLIASPILLLIEFIIGKFNPGLKSRSSLRIVQWAFRVIIFLSGVKLEVIGRENIPDDRPVLYVGNHRSYFDTIITYTLVKGETGYMSKVEIKKIPILRQWMKNLHCVFIDRSDIKQGLKAIIECIGLVKEGISVNIFPEGTRNRGKGMLEYKEGSMKVAEKGGCPIIPMAITGTAEIFEKHMPWIKKSHVTVTFGEPIEIDKLTKDERKFLGAYTREKILSMLPEYMK